MAQGGVMVVDRGSFYDISGANASNPRLLLDRMAAQAAPSG
jgi:hypothetical protein